MCVCVRVCVCVCAAAGALPVAWSALGALTELSLDSNIGLSGGVPSQWGALTTLWQVQTRMGCAVTPRAGFHSPHARLPFRHERTRRCRS